MRERTNRLRNYAGLASIPLGLAVTGNAMSEIIHWDGASCLADDPTYNVKFFSTGSNYNMDSGPAGTITGTFAFSMYASQDASSPYDPYFLGEAITKFKASAAMTNSSALQRLDYGDLIDGSNFASSFDSTIVRGSNPTSSGGSATFSGPFLGNSGYVGFSFSNTSGDVFYAWAFISQAAANYFTISEWAFDNTGGAIRAGQTQASNAVPGIGGIAALACGAAGLRRRRNRVD